MPVRHAIRGLIDQDSPLQLAVLSRLLHRPVSAPTHPSKGDCKVKLRARLNFIGKLKDKYYDLGFHEGRRYGSTEYTALVVDDIASHGYHLVPYTKTYSTTYVKESIRRIQDWADSRWAIA